MSKYGSVIKDIGRTSNKVLYIKLYKQFYEEGRECAISEGEVNEYF